MGNIIAFVYLGVALGLSSMSLSCSETPPSEEARPSGNHGKIGEIKTYDFGSKSVQTLKLPKALSEASGLALTDEGYLFSHNDELGIVFKVDYRTGEEIKRFYLGRPVLRRDFEGIAVKQDTIFMAAASGTLYRFLEGENEQYIEYETFKTALNASNDVEGLAYDPESDGLLLACKGNAGQGMGKDKAVYAFSLKTYKLDPQPRFRLPLQEIIGSTERKEFNPSSIERHPVTGNFFILAFNGMAIVEIDRAGKLLGVSKLPKSIHAQPEGLAIAGDGTLIIANEGQGKAAMLVIYSQ